MLKELGGNAKIGNWKYQKSYVKMSEELNENAKRAK